jgi:hypothetical protein
MARSDAEFRWTPIPSILAYCYYRLYDKHNRSCGFTYDEFVSRFKTKRKRALENKILNYRWLSGEGRGLKKAASVAKHVVSTFNVLGDDEIYALSMEIWNDELSDKTQTKIEKMATQWLVEMSASRATNYIPLLMEHGLEISPEPTGFVSALKGKKVVSQNSQSEIDPDDAQYLKIQYDPLVNDLLKIIESEPRQILEKTFKKCMMDPVI